MKELKFTVLIRNKNKHDKIFRLLSVLNANYRDYIFDVVIVDNESDVECLKIYSQFDFCKIVSLKEFSYGKALNIGMQNAKSNWVLLMSSHCLPVGRFFFEEIQTSIEKGSKNLAGLRLIMLYKGFDVLRYFNSIEVWDSFNTGMLANGGVVSKEAWGKVKFDEQLIAAEDKDWSDKVLKNGYSLNICPAVYYYEKKKDKKELLKRYEIENKVLFDNSNVSVISLLKKHFILVFVNPVKALLSSLIIALHKVRIDWKNISIK